MVTNLGMPLGSAPGGRPPDPPVPSRTGTASQQARLRAPPSRDELAAAARELALPSAVAPTSQIGGRMGVVAASSAASGAASGAATSSGAATEASAMEEDEVGTAAEAELTTRRAIDAAIAEVSRAGQAPRASSMINQ